MKILIDAQLPPGLKLMLAEAGHEALHVVDVGLRDADDGAGSGAPSSSTIRATFQWPALDWTRQVGE